MAKRKVQPGKALDWSEDDLDELSQIDAADIEIAQALWRDAVPAKLRLLLDADREADELLDVLEV